MRWLKIVVSEVFGLFVDDGSFAIAILVWLGAAWFFFVHMLGHVRWSGMILFAGLVFILIESAIRRAGQSQRRCLLSMISHRLAERRCVRP